MLFTCFVSCLNLVLKNYHIFSLYKFVNPKIMYAVENKHGNYINGTAQERLYRVYISFLYARRRWVVLCRALCPSVRPSVHPSVNFRVRSITLIPFKIFS